MSSQPDARLDTPDDAPPACGPDPAPSASDDAPGAAATPSPSAPRSSRALIGLLSANTLSLTGNVITQVALPLYVFSQTHSATTTGLVAIATTAPVVIGGALGGVLVDRFGYRRSSVVSDVVGAVTILAVPLLHWAGHLPMWALFVLIFATGLLDTPGQSARTALFPEAAARAGVDLERAMGWHGATERGARMIGAPLAGFLVAWLGPLPVLVLDAATFALSALLVARCVPRSLEDGVTEESTGHYLTDLAAGFKAVVRLPLVLAVTLMVLVTNALDVAKAQVLLPIYVTEHLDGARSLGLLVGVFGVGSVIGSLAWSAWGPRLPRRAVYTVGFMVCGGPVFLVFAANPGMVGCLAAMAVGGFASGALNPIIDTILLEQVPAGMRARVFGVVGAGAWAAMPLGTVLAGILADGMGLLPTLGLLGGIYLFVTVLPLVGTVWRGLDRPRVTER